MRERERRGGGTGQSWFLRTSIVHFFIGVVVKLILHHFLDIHVIDLFVVYPFFEVKLVFRYPSIFVFDLLKVLRVRIIIIVKAALFHHWRPLLLLFQPWPAKERKEIRLRCRVSCCSRRFWCYLLRAGGGWVSVGWIGRGLSRRGSLKLCAEVSWSIGALITRKAMWIWLSAELRHGRSTLGLGGWSV